MNMFYMPPDNYGITIEIVDLGNEVTCLVKSCNASNGKTYCELASIQELGKQWRKDQLHCYCRNIINNYLN